MMLQNATSVARLAASQLAFERQTAAPRVNQVGLLEGAGRRGWRAT